MAVAAVGIGGDAPHRRRFVTRTISDGAVGYHRWFVTRTGGDEAHHRLFVLRTGGDEVHHRRFQQPLRPPTLEPAVMRL